ncbi:MAG: hypothetical protein MI674_01505, partial [Cytophagales bacterium]|nr:hypothetical protein [Cytophagales bacterium]
CHVSPFSREAKLEPLSTALLIRMPFRAGSIRFLAPPLPAVSAIQRVYHVYRGKEHWIGCSLCTEALAFFPRDINFLLALGSNPSF